MEKRCTVLEREADLGNRLATKLDQLKDKPEEIFQMIEDFEAAVDWTEESEEKEKEVEAEKDKLLKQGQKLLDDGNNQEE
jgi:seryl-tRNA synthetase